MHILLSVLIGIAALTFWLGRAARGASDLADAANELGNLPRKLRYRKQAGKRGLDLVTSPTEAATILMISIARMNGTGRMSDVEENTIITQLTEHMHLPAEDASDLVLNLRSLTHHLNQADSALFPMLKILQGNISKTDAASLTDMLSAVANAGREANDEQKHFIYRYKERMGLNG